MNNTIKYTISIITIIFCLLVLLSSVACYPEPDDVILTSPDGVKWASVSIGKEQYIRSITWSNKLEKFVAIGDSLILTSTDGNKWIVEESKTERSFISIAWSDKLEKFVAIEYGGTMFSSTDGNNWIYIKSTTVEQLNPYSIAWSNKLERFVAVGYGNAIITSPDGNNWTVAESSIPSYIGNTLFIDGTAGKIIASRGELLYAIIWSDKLEKFIMVGVQYVSVKLEADQKNVPHITALSSGTVVGTTATLILTSPDGTTWTSINSGTQESMRSIAWSDKLQKNVAVGEYGKIITSTDGNNWTSVNSQTDEILTSIIWSDKLEKFIAVGYHQKRTGL